MASNSIIVRSTPPITSDRLRLRTPTRLFPGKTASGRGPSKMIELKNTAFDAAAFLARAGARSKNRPVKAKAGLFFPGQYR